MKSWLRDKLRRIVQRILEPAIEPIWRELAWVHVPQPNASNPLLVCGRRFFTE